MNVIDSMIWGMKYVELTSLNPVQIVPLWKYWTFQTLADTGGSNRKDTVAEIRTNPCEE